MKKPTISQPSDFCPALPRVDDSNRPMRLHADDLDLEEPEAAMAMVKSANGNRWKCPMTGDFHGKNMEEEGKSSTNLVDSPFNEIASSNQRQYL